MSAPEPPGPGVGDVRRGAGLFAIAAGTLLAEVTWTRLLSVSHLHVFAFLAVSTALLGGGAAARWVAARPSPPGAASDRRAAGAATLFALSVPAAQLAVAGIGFDPFDLRTRPAAWLELGAVYLALALPFAASGAAIAEILARRARVAPSLYAADLVGAAMGSLGALVLIPALDGSGALWAASALGLGGAAALAPRRIQTRAAALGAAVLALATALPLPVPLAPSKTTGRGEPFAAVIRDPVRHLGVEWTPHARVDHVRFAPGVERLVLDGGVAAVRVPVPGWHPRPTDATLPYELRPGARVLVIGSGAGWELVEAQAFGASRVVGVEVNPAVAEKTPASVRRDPGIEVIVDEARSFLETTEERFDVVVMIHTISNAATAAGALGLTEDHLLTQEAFARILDRLAPDGILLVTRPEAQLPRLLATLRAATGPDRPLGPRVAVWREAQGGFYGALLYRRSPWNPASVEAIRARLEERGLVPLHLPGDPARPDPVSAIVAGAELDPLARSTGLRLTPATDDTPFFHRRLPLAGMTRAPDASARAVAPRLALEERPLAELALLALLTESVLVGLILLAPFRTDDDAPLGARLRSAVTFSALGVGFMLLEIALVQRLGLLLGAPTRAVAVTFAGLLLGAGLGSHLARGATPRSRARLALVGALIFAVGGEAATRAALGAPLSLRTGLGALFAFGLGGLLGGVFPSLLARGPPGGGAFAFSVNAVASVAGTSLALILAPELGLSGIGLLAATLYGAVLLLAPR